jgi:predicted NBD/HSP70 family sugar kinase
VDLTKPSLAGAALTLIHTGQASSRSELTGRLGVTRATTGAITGELRDLGLIEVAAGSGDGQHGRPSHSLRPDPDGPVVLAAEVHADGFAVALIGLGAVIHARISRPAPAHPDLDRALAPVTDAAAALLREWEREHSTRGRSPRPCAGAAVAVQTAVTEPAETAVGALYLGWPDGTPVRDVFAARLAATGVTGPHGAPLACRAVNDVNAIALAEHRHGAGRDASHLLVVVAPQRGVGGALVQRGALYTGSTGLAMEAGHVSIDPNGRPCPCGNRGCLNVETDASAFLEAAGRAPASAARERADSAGGDIPAIEAAIATLTGGYATDPRVRDATAAIVERLGLGLASLINVVNPDRVLLGGLHKHLLLADGDRLVKAVAARSPWGRAAAVPIQPCALDDSALLGAAELAWQPVLDNPALLR